MSQKMISFLQFSLICCIFSGVVCDSAVNPTKPRQCYSCEGINCERITKQNVTISCTNALDYCVTIFDGFTVISKGCYLDTPIKQRAKCEGDDQNPECLKCFGQLCHNKGRKDFKCFECNDNAKCAGDISDVEPVQCPIPTSPNSYCFTRILGGNKIQRGCYVHTKDQMKCLQDASCSLCLAQDEIACNSYKLSTESTPSAGSQHLSNLALLMITMLSLARFFS